MYRRLIIITVTITAGLVGLSLLGFYSIRLHAEGLAGKRMAEFAEVAEQIRIDVKRKLDDFIKTEQARAHTDYLYSFVPEDTDIQSSFVRSPLAGVFNNDLAIGYFQIEPDGTIITPYYIPGQTEQPVNEEIIDYVSNLKSKLLNALNGRTSGGLSMGGMAGGKIPAKSEDKDMLSESRLGRGKELFYDSSQRARSYKIASLEKASQQQQQVVALNRAAVERNIDNTEMLRRQQQEQLPADEQQAVPAQQVVPQPSSVSVQSDMRQSEMVQALIEPFTSVVVPSADGNGIFGGDVFLLRHVQIENRHFLQGFKLDEDLLLRQLAESAERLLRSGMGFELAATANNRAAHVAILDFGFGSIILNLFEHQPQWLTKQISTLRNWYFAIIAVVFIAVIFALAGLWRTTYAQLRLARKKDDFISAVSHELRTPLTSIRMYTEMLEKNWVKDDAKRGEYYTTMRQETERLSRLIENVLDFSRIQRGKKKYSFRAGDINTCINDVIEMLRPCAERAGFVIEKHLADLPQTAFDSDAVMQIVINLLDNAIKYSAGAADKTISVRTTASGPYVFVEVEDHGPGIPRLQRKKVFDEFYRCGDESVRQTTGTGLGLALVKKFAEAHNGFVEILTAKPAGTILRVALAAELLTTG